jgi:hypothetical protein
MKVFGIIICIFLASISTIVLTDLITGFNFFDALSNLINPFRVIEPGEYVMLAFVLVLIVGQQIFIIMKNQDDKQNGSS